MRTIEANRNGGTSPGPVPSSTGSSSWSGTEHAMSGSIVHIGRIARVDPGRASGEGRFAACSCGWCSTVCRPALPTTRPDAVDAAEQDWLDHVAAQPGADRLRASRARRDDRPVASRYPLTGVSITRTEPGEECSAPG